MASNTRHPPGTLGVLSGDQSRWAWFAQSLLGLQMPANTQIIWVHGLWIAAAVNKLVEAMRADDQWLQIWADDHRFSADTLTRLLDHNVPLVAPLCPLRRVPYAPSLFHAEDGGGYRGYTWPELAGRRGLLPVDTFGGPGVVIRREVLDAVGAPFFESQPGQRVAPHEDLYTFNKCRLAGFQPYVDLDTPVGHILPIAVYPQRLQSADYALRLWGEETLVVLPTSESERKSDVW